MKIRLLILGVAGLLFLSDANAQQPDSTLTFLALGDSYTIGENVSEQQRWPVQLVDQLETQGYQFEDPDILAATGWTTQDLKEAMKQVEFNAPYDLVSLLIGVNDQYQKADINQYPKRFRYLLEKAISLSGDKPNQVYVLSIPDYSVTPVGQQRNPDTIYEEIDAYNAFSKKITDSLGVHYINITPISRQATSNPALVADDGLHPSGKMYTRWVEKMMPVLLSELKSSVGN